MIKTEKEYWDQAKELLGNYEVTYDANWKFDFINDPKSLLFHLSRCKFAMRMATKDRAVLELGCEIGIGASVLGEMAKSYLGVDRNPRDIEIAKKNIVGPKHSFLCDEYIGKKYGVFDSVIAFDVLNKIESGRMRLFLDGVLSQLSSNGIFILGLSVDGGCSAAEIGDKLRLNFFQVWTFGMNGEILHTNPENGYSIFLCCHKI